jgi:hypothetical protein
MDNDIKLMECEKTRIDALRTDPNHICIPVVIDSPYPPGGPECYVVGWWCKKCRISYDGLIYRQNAKIK